MDFNSWMDISLVNLLDGVFVVLSIIGQEFISRRKSKGFYFWIASNICGLVLFAIGNRPLMMLLYVYFLVRCIQGLATWRHLESKESQAPRLGIQTGQGDAAC